MTSKHLIEIWEGGNESPERPVKHDENTEKFLNINLKQISLSYDGPDKKEVKTVKTFPVSICSADYFKTDYEKMFYDLNKDNHLLCAEDPSIFL